MGRNGMGTNVGKFIVAGLLLGLIGCGNSGGGGDEGGDTVYTPDGVGTISLRVNEDLLSVSDTSGFRATLVNAAGQPVPFTRISCDSEAGIAIVEPTTGVEISDENGQISGVIGCEAPGSYLFGCRAAVGANKRVFQTIRCAGPIPSGFGGFPGAAGGGLGTGGSGDSDDGGPGGGDTDNGVTVTAIRLQDSGGDSSTLDSSIDIGQIANCDGDATTNDPEPFFDTRIAIDVRNNSNSSITFTSYSYEIESTGGSVTFESNDLGFLNSGEVASGVGKTKTLSALFARASGASKFFYQSSTAISAIGFTNVNVTIRGTNDQGDSVVATASTAVSFDNYDRCDG